MVGLLIGRGETGVISMMQVLLLFAVGSLVYKIFSTCGYPNAGLGAVIVLLLNPNAAFWSMMLMTETMAGFFLALGLLCFVKYWKTSRRRWLFGAGMALSAAALTRPIVYPLAIGMGIIFLLVEWRRTRLVNYSLKVTGIFIIGILTLVIPWQLRNQVVHGQFTLSEVGESTFQNWYVAQTLASAEGYSRDEASAIIAQSANPMRYSLEVIRTYPVIFIKEQARGIMRTLLGAEYGSWSKAIAGEDTTTTGVLSAFLDQGSPGGIFEALKTQITNTWFWAGMYAFFYDVVLFIAVIWGTWRVFREYRQEVVFNLAALLVVSLFYLLIIPGVAGESRFRVPADPLLALAAGMAFLPRRKIRSD
jgi:4-amino-4-deoxy-L-arabinose transferase-like glycosyltransferase